MAEFCLDCYNQYVSDKKLTEEDVILDIDLCEGCGEIKPCVIREKKKTLWWKIKKQIKQIHDKYKTRQLP